MVYECYHELMLKVTSDLAFSSIVKTLNLCALNFHKVIIFPQLYLQNLSTCP